MEYTNIHAEEFIIGNNVVISPSAIIRGLSGKAKRIEIGDNTYIGDNVQIIVDDLNIGDYCKIHHHVNFHGYLPLIIGHNAWIGQGSIIDSIGGTVIGNNLGVGAYSQLWSHIRYGDPLAGCNYNSASPLTIGNDVWLVGHCIVSPVNIQDRSMALVGSVITKDMEYGRIYGGSPAKDLTDKIPPQFREISIDEKWKIMNEFTLPLSVKLVDNKEDMKNDAFSYFNIVDRTYSKMGTIEEVAFMKALQSKLIKFVPIKIN
jgi:acetyltransferase-like isoleucine patch superfamily enzyme